MCASIAGESSIRKDQMNCALCNSPFSDPKLLPCLHTFCLGCLTKNCDVKESKCPTCSGTFSLSDGGFKALPTNEFFIRLLKLQKIVPKESTSTSCSACSDTTGTTGPKRKVMATVYCLDCEQDLCPACEKIHKNLKITSIHTTIAKDELGNSPRPLEKFAKPKVQLCPQHPNERISLFCCNCNCTICTVCCVTQHKTHNCEDIGPAAQKFRSQLSQNIEDVMKLRQIYLLDKEDLFTKRQRYLNNVDEIASTVKENAESAKKLIDKLADELLMKLDVTKSVKLEANISYEHWHDSRLESVEHCLQFLLDVLTTGSDEEVAGLSGSIYRRMIEIAEKPPDVINLSQLSFTPSLAVQLTELPKETSLAQRIQKSPAAECLAQNALGAIQIS